MILGLANTHIPILTATWSCPGGEEEFPDQGLKVSWDNLGTPMGSELRSPTCERLRGKRKQFPWVVELLSQQRPPTGRK